MYTKITFQELAALLALNTGQTKKVCEDFLRELFAVITGSLLHKESVRLKGLGTFKLTEIEPRKSVNVVTGEDMEIPGHYRVTFTPSKDLAEAVNLPFSAFEAVEVADSISEDELNGETGTDSLTADENSGTETDIEITSFNAEANKEVEATADMFVDNPDDEPVVVEDDDMTFVYDNLPPEHAADVEDMPLHQDKKEYAEEEEEVFEEPEDPEKVVRPLLPVEGAVPVIRHRKRRHKFAWSFAMGFVSALFLCVIVAVIAYYAIERKVTSPDPVSEIKVESIKPIPVPSQSASETKASGKEESTAAEIPVTQAKEKAEEEKVDVPTAPSDRKVYDTVSTTRYLTTMAKEHYGNYHLWPYIYEENKAILGHPDRIRPGTKVVIPPLSKYGVDPNNKADIQEAKRKGAAIYARYK